MTDQSESAVSKGPMQVGKKATVRVSYTVDEIVEVEMPVDGDPGEQAMFELWVQERLPDDPFERTLIHAEIEDEEPVYEDEFDSSEGWPSYV